MNNKQNENNEFEQLINKYVKKPLIFASIITAGYLSYILTDITTRKIIDYVPSKNIILSTKNEMIVPYINENNVKDTLILKGIKKEYALLDKGLLEKKFYKKEEHVLRA